MWFDCTGYVFSNLPGNWFNTIVRAFLSIELALTFPIVIKPATDVMEEIWKNILMVWANLGTHTFTHTTHTRHLNNFLDLQFMCHLFSVLQ